MAPRLNSSRAPESPLSRIRSKPWWVFKCANLISTRFRSSRDLANAFVFIFRRAISRASSWRSRGILRASAVVQGGSPGRQKCQQQYGTRRSCWLVENHNLRNESPRITDVRQSAILAKRGEVLPDVTEKIRLVKALRKEFEQAVIVRLVTALK